MMLQICFTFSQIVVVALSSDKSFVVNRAVLWCGLCPPQFFWQCIVCPLAVSFFVFVVCCVSVFVFCVCVCVCVFVLFVLLCVCLLCVVFVLCVCLVCFVCASMYSQSCQISVAVLFHDIPSPVLFSKEGGHFVNHVHAMFFHHIAVLFCKLWAISEPSSL